MKRIILVIICLFILFGCDSYSSVDGKVVRFSPSEAKVGDVLDFSKYTGYKNRGGGVVIFKSGFPYGALNITSRGNNWFEFTYDGNRILLRHAYRFSTMCLLKKKEGE